MSGFEDYNAVCLSAFSSYVEGWESEPSEYVSLSKYSIARLLKLDSFADEKPRQPGGSRLRAAVLKREHDGASRFIYWAFGTDESQITSESSRSKKVRPRLGGIGEPQDEAFKLWRDGRSFSRLVAPTATAVTPNWELAFLTDYADEFLHLRERLSACIQSESGVFRGTGLASSLDKFVYFGRARALEHKAKAVLKVAVAEQHHGEDLLLQSLDDWQKSFYAQLSAKASRRKRVSAEKPDDFEMESGDLSEPE